MGRGAAASSGKSRAKKKSTDIAAETVRTSIFAGCDEGTLDLYSRRILELDAILRKCEEKKKHDK